MRHYELIGGGRDGEYQTILHGNRVMSPKRDGAGFEEWTVTFVPSLNRDALVLNGLGEIGIDRVLAARNPRQP